MLDYYELIDRLERLPVSEVTRSLRRRRLVAAEANVDWTVHCVDALLEWIEGSNVAIRFVPDWADEAFKNAA